jgi:uncharacterized protein
LRGADGQIAAVMQVLLRLIAGLVALGILAVLAVVVLHRSYLYQFSGEAFSIAGFAPEAVAVVGQPDLPVQVFHAVDPAAPVIIYFMGNAGALQIFERPLTQMRDAGFSVVAMPLRNRTDARLRADALAVFDWTQGWAKGPTLLRGFWEGNGLAVAVAEERVAAAVILPALSSKGCTFMSERTELPYCLLPSSHIGGSQGQVSGLAEPVLILQSADYPLWSIHGGYQLPMALRSRGANVTFVPIEGGDHLTLDMDPVYGAAVATFLAEGA